MKNKNNKVELNKIFSDLYLLEKQARDTYSDFLKTLKDEEEIKIVKKIKNDEIRHMEIVQKILSLIK